MNAATKFYPLVDRRCSHPRCTEKDAYRMVGHCTNCGHGPLLLLISAGHGKPSATRCPRCACYDVQCDRAATDDELPDGSAP